MNLGLPGRRKPESTSGIEGYRLVRIFGFDVKLNLTWLLLALLITSSLGAGLFPVEYPGLSPHTYWWMGVAGAIGIHFSIVFHELSHALVGRRLRLTVKGITLFIFGGVAEMKKAGRPRILPELRKLIERMWEASPTWGSPKIVAELAMLGINVAKSTVEKYQPKRAGPSSPTWRTFLDQHVRDLVSIDFFIVPTATFRVLFVFIVLAHDRRRIVIST